MEQSDARGKFAQANQAYTDGDYERANTLLTELDAEFPGNLNLMKAHARTLAKLGRYEEAIAICGRLEREFGYEKARAFRETVAAKMQRRGEVDLGVHSGANSERPDEAVELEEMPDTADGPENRRRLTIKPVRLALLILIGAGMYGGYLPYWAGGGLIAAYFVLKLGLKVAAGKAALALFSIPFKMKGKALAGATVELHGIEWTQKPRESRDECDDEEAAPGRPVPLRYAWLDVTIAPPGRSQGFTHWEPGELMVAPSNIKIRNLDDMDKCSRIHAIKFIVDGEEIQEAGEKVCGPRRIKVLAEFPEDTKALKFVYYSYSFGDVPLG